MSIVSTVTDALQTVLDSSLNDLARECGVVIRERKFNGQSLLRMIVLTLLEKPKATAWDFLSTATELGLDVTQTAVEKRLAAGQPLIDFLKKALARALVQVVASQPDAAKALQGFSHVFLGDATTIPLDDLLAEEFPACGCPDKPTQAAAKLQVLWDIKTGQIVQLEIVPGKSSDAKSGIAVHQAPKGSLLIYDLGYFSIDRFAALDDADAFFLSRYQHNTNIYQDQEPDSQLSLLDLLRKAPGNIVDQTIRLGSRQRLSCRLIAIRVPQEIANRRRQKARERMRDKEGREPSAEYLELLGWNLYVTNCSCEQLSWREVVVLYRARWQMEVLFKLWKSHNGLARQDSSTPVNDQMVMWYGRLLAVLLQHWLILATAWQMAERSLLKAARVLREQCRGLVRLIDDSVGLMAELTRLQKVMQRIAKVKARKSDPSHAQLLNDPELLDWAA